MSYVTTAVPHRQLVLERDDDGNPTKVVGRTPLEVSKDEAAEIVETGKRVGIEITVSESKQETEQAPTSATATPSLATGSGATTGTGEAVSDRSDAGSDEKASGSSSTQDKKGR